MTFPFEGHPQARFSQVVMMCASFRFFNFVIIKTIDE